MAKEEVSNFIEDGAAFIREVQEQAPSFLHMETLTSGKSVYILEVGHGIANEILVGQYRQDKEGNILLDALAIVDRSFMLAIAQCVVNAEGKPLWKMAQVQMMATGPKQAAFRDLLTELYDLVVQWNPHISPAGNPTALRKMLRLF